MPTQYSGIGIGLALCIAG